MNMLLAKTAAAPTAKNSFIFTVLGAKWGILWLWLLIINVLALVVYGVDKALAKIKEHAPKARRIPEKTLLLLAALGGGAGAWLAMELFRHVPLFTLIWIVVIGGLYLYFNVIR